MENGIIYALQLGMRKTVLEGEDIPQKYFICELNIEQIQRPSLMYKVADFVHSIHVSNSLSFNYSILFIAYDAGQVAQKYLLYTNSKSVL